jgi:iron complex outermembrane receptor protein
LFDRRVRFNAAAFRYDIDSPQVQLIQQGAVIQSNAGGARIYGAEFEGEALVADGLTLRFSGTYLDAKYTDYTNAPSSPPIFEPPFGTAPTTLIDATGNRPPLTSKFTYAVGFDYKVNTGIGEFQLTADYSHHSGFFWEQDNVLRQRPIGLLDARLKLALSDQLGISVWGKNLTDEKYSAFAVSLQGRGGYPYVAAAPRTVGATIDFKF